MAPLTDDCFALSGRLIPLREVTAMIQSRFACAVVAEAVSLTDAGDRALAEDVMAPISVPSETHSAVDGSAVHFDDLSSPRETVLPLRGRSAAGHLIPAPLPRGYAARMFTGALMPDGADAVLMQEDRVAGDDAVRIRVGINLGANHRLAGEDVVAGETILLAGRRLGPPEIGLVASLRHAAVRVGRGLRAALFSRPATRWRNPPRRHGQIDNSNRFMAAGLPLGLPYE